MNDTPSIIDTDNSNAGTARMYSIRAIGMATFIGGPIAAGVLARTNFITQGRLTAARNALFIGVISGILLFIALFTVPEDIWDKIPNAIIPLIYTGIVYFLIERFQGKALTGHKEMNLPFYSVWRAMGIGVICLVIYAGSIVIYAYNQPVGFDAAKYDAGVAELIRNEGEAMLLFSNMESASAEKKIEYIDNVAIPACRRNFVVLDEMHDIEGLTKVYVQQVQIYRQYMQLLMEALELARKAAYEQTEGYDQQIEELFLEIDRVLKQL